MLDHPEIATAGPLSRRALLSGQVAAGGGLPLRWRLAEPPESGAKDVLWSGLAIGAGTWLVGDNGTVHRYEGGRLQRMETPVVSPLHSLWGDRDDRLLAVGWMGVILRYDGATWSKLAGEVIDKAGRFDACAENTPLFAIAGDASGRVWAAGDNGRVLVSSTGETWTALETGTRAHLRAIATGADGAVLIGGLDGTLLRSTDGEMFEALEPPVRTNIFGLAARSADDFIAVGGRYFAPVNGFRGEICRHRPGGWEPVESDEPLARLRDVADVDGEYLIAGDRGRLYALRGGAVRRLETPCRHDLMGVVRGDGAAPVVVGDFGSILVPDPVGAAEPVAPRERTAAVWRSEANPAAGRVQLWGIHGTAGDNIFACGEAGTMLHFDGAAWRSMATPTGSHIHAVWAASDSCAYAVGQVGEILAYDGTGWSLHFRMPVDVTAVALWGTEPDNVFVVGDEGLILHWDGISWTRQVSGTKSALYGIWGLDPEHVLAVGDFGLVLRYNGTQWDEFSAGTEHFLYDVWGDGLANIFVVGLSGTVGRFDGTRWTVAPTRIRTDLIAVEGRERAVFAVGTGGTACRFEDGRWLEEPTEAEFGLRDLWIAPDGTAWAVGDRGTILRRAAPPGPR